MLFSDIFGTKSPGEGEVGIEVEQEFFRAIDLPLFTYWNAVNDGSLRQHGVEFVTKTPVKRENIKASLKELNKFLVATNKNNDHESPRTSVHIHTNTLDMTPIHMWNQIIIYWILDSCMVELCGIYRVTNLFCLRLRDGTGIIDNVKLELTPNTSFHSALTSENYRYSSQNLVALSKFRSIEYRSKGGKFDMVDVEEWINALLSIKDAARTFTDPCHVLNEFYSKGARSFIKRVLTPEYCDKMFGIKDHIEKVTYNADLLIDLVGSTDWERVMKAKTNLTIKNMKEYSHRAIALDNGMNEQPNAFRDLGIINPQNRVNNLMEGVVNAPPRRMRARTA